MIFLAAFYVFLGALIKYGKMYFLIAGYNTMSKKEQVKYDIEGIASLFRNVMFVMALIIILGYVAQRWFNVENGEWIAFFISILLGIPSLLIGSNSDKYKIPGNRSQ